MTDLHAQLQVNDVFDLWITGYADPAQNNPHWGIPHNEVGSALQEYFANKGGELVRVGNGVFFDQDHEQSVPTERRTRSRWRVNIAPTEMVTPGEFDGLTGLTGGSSLISPSAFAAPAAIFVTLAILAVVGAAIVGTAAVLVSANIVETVDREYEFVETLVQAGVPLDDALDAADDLDGPGMFEDFGSSIFSGATTLVLAGALLFITLAIVKSK